MSSKVPTFTFRWVTGAWDSCSKSCSGGFQSRDVHCMEFVNEDFIISDDMCKDLKKPSSKQSCKRDPCPPKWVTEPFGQVSLIPQSPLSDACLSANQHTITITISIL